MNHDHIVDHDLIGRYRRDALAADETEAFEAHLVGCDECQALLAADARLERGLRTMAARPTLRTAPRWRTPPRFALAAAAVLAIVVAAPWLAWSWSPPVAGQAGLPLFHLAFVRGPEAETIELRIPLRVAWYALELETPGSRTACCRVVIEDADGATVWEGETQVAPNTGLVRVLLSRSVLQTGSYRIVLYATATPAVRLIEHQVLVQLDR